MLKARVITALALLGVVLACLFYFPGWVWEALVMLALAVGAKEWSGFARYIAPVKWGYVILTPLLAIFILHMAPQAVTHVFVAAALFWVLAVPLWLGFGWHTSHPLLMALSGWLVLVPTMLALIGLRENPALLFSLMSVVWLADIGAYFSGRRFGRHKLAPSISPGKSWEGVWGGLLTVAIYAGILFVITEAPRKIFGGEPTSLLKFLAVLWLLTGFSIMGDLFESWMKRQVGLKDSGSFLPGHGGLLDRIDAMTSTLPLAMLALILAHELNFHA